MTLDRFQRRIFDQRKGKKAEKKLPKLPCFTTCMVNKTMEILNSTAMFAKNMYTHQKCSICHEIFSPLAQWCFPLKNNSLIRKWVGFNHNVKFQKTWIRAFSSLTRFKLAEIFLRKHWWESWDREIFDFYIHQIVKVISN